MSSSDAGAPRSPKSSRSRTSVLSTRETRASKRQKTLPVATLPTGPSSSTPVPSELARTPSASGTSPRVLLPASSGFHSSAYTFTTTSVGRTNVASSSTTQALSTPVVPGSHSLSQIQSHAPISLPSATVTPYLFPPPQSIRQAPLLPTTPEIIRLVHPANNLKFLRFPAYDPLPGPQTQFGLHHETVLTACRIVAYNNPGYLSTFRDRNAAPVNVTPDSALRPGSYYYHLDDPKAAECYPICDEFQNWSFPHGKVPPSWTMAPTTTPGYWPSGWTAISERVKVRDSSCLISRSVEYLTTAHIVGEEHDHWLNANDMEYYLGDTVPLHQAPQNLCCLRYDLYMCLFDRGQFVVVPKCGNLVVHFLKRSEEAANLYHNTGFDHKNHGAPEALYARFAWALIKIIKDSNLDPESFKFLETDDDEDRAPEASGKGKEREHKRKHDDMRGGNVGGEDSDEHDGYSGTHRSRSNQDCDASPPPLQPDPWLSDVLLKLAPGNQSSIEADTHEIQQDLKKAARDHPFLVDPTIEPTAHNYHNLVWYPGIQVVQRRKQAYLDSHPHIRAFSDPHLQSNSAFYNSDSAL